MKNGTIIEIMEYGDFGIKQTTCIMVSEDNFIVDDLTKEFCLSQNIEFDEIGQLYDKNTSLVTQDYITFLRTKGFKTLETKQVCFSN